LTAIALAGVVIGISSGRAAAYSAYSDFSPSSVVWSYGYGTTGSSFTAYSDYFTNDSVDGCSVPGDSVTCGEISPAGLPEVAKITGSTVDKGTDVLVTNALYMHPGASDDSIVQFTAPVAATYSVSGFFETLDTNPQTAGVLLTVVAGTTTELSQVLAGEPASFPGHVGGVVDFNFTVALSEGETIEFGVNDDGSFGSNGTGFDATITPLPEPKTWAFMLLGVAGVGSALRRSRSRRACSFG
jgi:hypothetical protein